MKRLFPITTVLLSSTSLAWAVDPASLPVLSWSGFYVGGSFGYAALNDRVSHSDGGDGCWWTCADVQSLTDKPGGVIGGLQGGYNWQFGRSVLGLEADLSAASNSGSLEAVCGTPPCDYLQSSRLSALGTMRGRFGLALDKTLVYVTGGWAIGSVKNHVNNASDAAVWNINQWRNGWTAGGGFEYALAGSWSVKAEALYYDLGEKSQTAVYDSKGLTYYPAKFRNDGVVARAGVNFRFGAPAAPTPTRY